METMFSTLRRPATETVWEEQADEMWRSMVEEAMLGAATSAGATLESRTPIAGWETNRHSRDGKYWPCKEFTLGARPCWIWKAR